MFWRAERRDKNTAACKLLCSCKLASPSSRAFRRELHCGQLRRSSSNGNARTGWSYAIFWKLNRRSRMLVGSGFMLCSWMLLWWRFPPPPPSLLSKGLLSPSLSLAHALMDSSSSCARTSPGLLNYFLKKCVPLLHEFHHSECKFLFSRGTFFRHLHPVFPPLVFLPWIVSWIFVWVIEMAIWFWRAISFCCNMDIQSNVSIMCCSRRKVELSAA